MREQTIRFAVPACIRRSDSRRGLTPQIKMGNHTEHMFPIAITWRHRV